MNQIANMRALRALTPTLIALAPLVPAQSTTLSPLYAAAPPDLAVLEPSTFEPALVQPNVSYRYPNDWVGVAFRPDGVLIVADNDGYASDLTEMDPDSGAILRVTRVQNGLASIVYSMAYRAETDELYAIVIQRPIIFWFPELVVIDLATGQARLVRYLHEYSWGIAFSPDGRLYHLLHGSLEQLDPDTGAVLAAVSTATSIHEYLAVRPTDGAVIAASQRGDIARIDPTTGAVTPLGSAGRTLGDLDYRLSVSGIGCAGTAPLVGPTAVPSPAPPATWRCPRWSPQAGACVTLLWPPARAPLALPDAFGCTQGHVPCVLASTSPAVSIPNQGSWTAAIPAGLAPGPLFLAQCACLQTARPACVWLSAETEVRIVP